MFVPRGLPVAPRSGDQIEKIGNMLRGGARGYLDIVKFAEHTLAEVIDGFDLIPVSPDKLPPCTEALADVTRPIIKVSEHIYDAACDGAHRPRFTIAHEIGHLVLHRNQLSAFARRSEKTPHQAYEDSEWQADTFAGAILAPLIEVRSFGRIQDISDTYGISYSAATIRYKKSR